ncbi:MAG: hypothetical protein LBQ89_06530 [Treponema sp.]|jgi:hypothetical protein|nr:hypothetical protein [Treponema sp.]
MNKFDLYFVRIIIIVSLLLFFIIISIIFPHEIISDIINNELIFAHEYMSGGDDDIAFKIAFILFLPVTIIYFIRFFRKNRKEPIIILLITILFQIIFTNIFLEYGNFYLNLLYGSIIFKLWVIAFGLIISYAIINLLIKIIAYNM